MNTAMMAYVRIEKEVVKSIRIVVRAIIVKRRIRHLDVRRRSAEVMMNALWDRDAIIAHWTGRRGTMRRQVASRGASIIVAILIRALKAGYAIEGAVNV